MTEGSSARKLSDPVDSLFPPDEPASYCSRPTPLVPPPADELRQEKLDAHSSGTHVIGTPSSRPTLGAGELDAFPYTSSDRPTYAPDDVLAEMLERATVGTPIPAPPLLPTLIVEPAKKRRPSGRARLARIALLLGLSGSVAALGYTFQPRLAGPVEVLRARIAAFVATH